MKGKATNAKKIAKQLILKEMISYFLEGHSEESAREIAYEFSFDAENISIWDFDNPEIDKFADCNVLNENAIQDEAQKVYDLKIEKFIKGYMTLINEFKQID